MILNRSPILSVCILAFVACQLAQGSPFGRFAGSNYDSLESDMDGGQDQDTFIYQKRLVPSRQDLTAELQSDLSMDEVYDHLLKKCRTIEQCRAAMTELIRLQGIKRNQEDMGPKRPFRWGK